MSLQPTEVLWKPVGELPITGSRVYVGDSWMIGADSVALPITPGTYDIDTKIFYYGSDDRVAVLRGRLRGSSPDGSREGGEFGVDVASAGVIDADAFDRWVQVDPVAAEKWQERFCEDGAGDLTGFFPCEGIDGAMLYTSTGFGDGSYKVVTLLEGDKPVGFEATFLEEGTGYFLETPQPATAGARPKPSVWKAIFTLLWVIPFALIALLFAVTFGLVGIVLLKLVALLRRLAGR